MIIDDEVEKLENVESFDQLEKALSVCVYVYARTASENSLCSIQPLLK